MNPVPAAAVKSMVELEQIKYELNDEEENLIELGESL